MLHIGERIKYFRTRAGLSQMDLELLTQCAFGSLCRFESNKVHPNPQTIEYICQALKLNELESSYLLGSIAYPASAKEIELVRNEVHDILEQPGFFGYIIDERWRLHGYSTAFAKFLGLEPIKDVKILNKLLNSTFIEIILLPELQITGALSDEESYHNLKMSLKFYHQENAFMIDDQYFQQSLKAIRSNKVASQIWDEFNNKTHHNEFPTTEDRKIIFKIVDKPVTLYFNNQSIPKYPRFKLVELLSPR